MVTNENCGHVVHLDLWRLAGGLENVAVLTLSDTRKVAAAPLSTPREFASGMSSRLGAALANLAAGILVHS
jgi:hypothetical protein